MKLKLLWFKYRIIHFFSKFISYFKNMSLTEEKFLKCLDEYLEKYVEKFEDYQISNGTSKMKNESITGFCGKCATDRNGRHAFLFS